MKFITPTMTQKFSRELLKIKANSPRTLFVVGLAGVVGGAVLACRATLKLEKTLDVFKDELDEVKSYNPEKTLMHKDGVEYTKSHYNKDLAVVYAKGTFNIIRLYAPAILIGSAGLGALTASHVTLSKRNASLTAAYSALHSSYDAYRSRVREEVGEDKERDIYQNARYEQEKVNGKNEQVRHVDPNKHSPYARFFDEYSKEWKKNAEYNRIFLQVQQKYANDLLHARGHIFLNEVYDMLGMERSSAGQVVGWVVGPNGDNYVDFGIFDPNNSAFTHGMERSILLDFNVDGVVYDKI